MYEMKLTHQAIKDCDTITTSEHIDVVCPGPDLILATWQVNLLSLDKYNLVLTLQDTFRYYVCSV